MKELKVGAFALLGLFTFSCRDNPSSTPTQGYLPPIRNAAYILNEGNFNDATGARLSIYDIDRDTVYKDVYELCNNGEHLGSTGDDIKLYHDRAYILMSHSENLVAVSLQTHQKTVSASFPGSTPHDMIIDSAMNKLYVSRTNRGSVFVLDPTTLNVLSTITVGNNPQGMALSGNNLFVCNSGYDQDRTVSVVDRVADTVKSTITVSDGPTNAVTAPDGRVWVVCRGNAFGVPPTPGRIFIINPTTLLKEDSIEFGQNLHGIIAIDTNGYAFTVGAAGFFGGPVHRVSLSSGNVETNFIPDTSYVMAVDQIDGDVYVGDVKRFVEDGVMSVYTGAGVLRKRFSVQLGPGAIAFRHQ